MNQLPFASATRRSLTLLLLCLFFGGASGSSAAPESGAYPGSAGVPLSNTTSYDPIPAYGPNLAPDIMSGFVPRILAARRDLPSMGEALNGPPGADAELGGWNEPAIAVNPTNPLNLAYASAFEMRVTTDGGVTWMPAVPATCPAGYAGYGDPCVAFDADGRLFWCYLATWLGAYITPVGSDILIAQCDPATGIILPGYPVDVTLQLGHSAMAGTTADKEWLAADAYPESPYANRLYVAWTEFPASGPEITLTSSSADHGLTWLPVLQLGPTDAASFVWPVHAAVAPNGDVYVADHRQPGFVMNMPNGTSGFVNIYRSADGGLSFPQVSQAFTAGHSDMTFNLQTANGHIPGTRFLLQGSVQPWILPDPIVPGRLYVIENDDPDNDATSGDPANVVIATSVDYAVTWSAPVRVDHGPGTTFQVMPTAAIDQSSGAIVVHYYDNRSGLLNGGGNDLLDLYATASLDGGATFLPEIKVNDLPFDPDAGARCRYNCPPFITDVWADAGGGACAVAVSGQLLKYNGITWSIAATTAAPKYGIWGSSMTNVILCGGSGQILRYDGSAIFPQTSGTTRDLFAIDGRSGSDIYVVGAAGTVRHYDGVSWTSMAPGIASDLHDVWASPTGTIFVVGDNGVVLRHDGSWTNISPGGGDVLLGVWGASNSDVYVTASSGAVHHWDGSAWTSLDPGIWLQTGLWGNSPSSLRTLGFGRIRHYDGVAWSEEAVSEHFLFRIHGTAANNIFAVGENAEIQHFDGTSWTRQSNPLAAGNPTLRIGEYNGVAEAGGESFVVWCGNTSGTSGPQDQQSLFDRFTTSVAGVDVQVPPPALNLALEMPWPNPANRRLAFAYSLSKASAVDLSLFDVQGRHIATLIHGDQATGRHVWSWDGWPSLGHAGGIYLLRLTDGRETVTRRVALVRARE